MAERRTKAGESRERIAQAARRLFAEEGYERTTIRAVAAEARIDPAMVMRYFGSKEGLFAAVTDFDLRLPDIAGLPRAAVGATLVRHFLARWEDEEDDPLIVLLRASTSNEEARTRMREIFASQVRPMIESVVPDTAEARFRAELIGSQVMGLAFARFVLGLPGLGGDDTERIVRGIAPVIEMHLFGLAQG